MTDRRTAQKIVCMGGLDSTNNSPMLSDTKPGAATRLVNYEAAVNGGYRRVNGYRAYSEAFPEVGVGVAEGAVLGIAIFDNTNTGDTEIYAIRKDIGAATYSYYIFDSGWVPVVTGITSNWSDTIEKVRYAVASDGVTNYICFVDGYNHAVLFDGTTWAEITVAHDGNALATAGGDQAINAPFLCQFFSNSLFLACDVQNDKPALVVASAPSEYYNFANADGAVQIPIKHSIVDMKPFRDSLYVFCANAITKIIDSDTGFTSSDITANMGCVARDSVVEIGGDLIFLAPDGFRPVTGTDKIGDVQLETISKAVHRLLQQRIAGLRGRPVNTVTVRSKSQFRVFLDDDSVDMDAAKGIIAGLRTPDQLEGWEFGELLGFRASCATSRIVEGVELVIHGDYDGKVYQQESGNDLNGLAMTSVYSTPYLDFGDTMMRKTAIRIKMFFEVESDLNTGLVVQYDWGNPNTLVPNTYALGIVSDSSTYDDPDVEYDDAAVLYDGFSFPVVDQNIQGSFFSIRLTFSTTVSSDPHTLQAIIVEYRTEGDR